MRYVDHIKESLNSRLHSTTAEAPVASRRAIQSATKKAYRTSVQTGRMSKQQRVARIWSDAKRRGDHARASNLEAIYRKLTEG